MATPQELLERNTRIDKVNAVRRQAGAKPIDYKAGDDVLTAAENWDYVANKAKVVTPTIQTPQATVTPPVTTPSLKPANLDQETYDFMLGQGIPQSRIDELYAPNEKNPFTRMFKEETPEPTPIDEKKVQASRNLANLGEGVKVLGDMFGVGQGAHIERRNAGDITNKQQATETSERDKYLAKLDQFNQGKRGAAEKDWMLALNDKEKGLKQVQADMNAQKAAEAAAKKAQREDDRWAKEYNLKLAGLKQKAANDAERNRIAGIKANKDAKTEKKAEKDPNMIQVNVGGTTYWVRKTFKNDVVGRVRKEKGGADTVDTYGNVIKNPINAMSDDELFNQYKDDYFRVSDDKKQLYVAHEALKPNSVIGNKGGAKAATEKQEKINTKGAGYNPTTNAFVPKNANITNTEQSR